MREDFVKIIKSATGATAIELVEVIQELWSGYGTINRYRLTGGERESVVVKHVHLSDPSGHPRGWNTGFSHQRKLKSYRIETTWYETWAQRCGDACRIAACLVTENRDDETLMVFEDLDASGFAGRRELVSEQEIQAGLHWLANFHATFLGSEPVGLWEQGTYWQLATRPDELEALDDLVLKHAAGEIDRRLSESRYQTLVHGDAKLANFCFSEDGRKVAAVDFQYVGGGCGMKDVAYFVGSCLNEEECEENEAWLLDTYFAEFEHALELQQPGADADAVEAEWRELFPFAWADFHRFLKGWSPGHWKINSYSERMAQRVVGELKSRENKP